MPARPPRRSAHRAAVGERRSPLSTAGSAVAASVLGLALAASITAPGTAAPLPPAPPTVAQSTTVDPSVTEPFTFADADEPLLRAIVAERAAQRAEELAKDAAAVSRAATEAAKLVRQDGLTAVEQATQAQGQELARQALQRAAAARAAAVTARFEAAAAAQAEADAAARAQTEAADRAAAEAESLGRATMPPPHSTAPPTEPTAAAQPTAPTEPAQPMATTQPTGPDERVGPAAPPVGSNAGGASPVSGAVVGAGFGQYGVWSRYHTGVDFRAAYGVPVRAVTSGVVMFAGNSGDWAGNHVAVRHARGITSMSSHLSSMTVSPGQTVQPGEVIGYVGQTGRAFGAHLHFEVYPAGARFGDVYRAVDPVPWLHAAGVTTR